MKSTELRIGNIVVANWSTGDWTQHTVTAGDFGISAAGTLVCESFQPERLTEEWLNRFGFRNGTTVKLSQHTGAIITRDTGGWILYAGHNCMHVRFQFVHQLQNLYFALTGTELTLP